MRRRFPILLLLILLGIYTAWYLVAARSQPAVTMVDYWHHLQLAQALSLSRVETWIHPFYPAGYFALLRLGLASGVDVLRYGQFLSWAGSIGYLTALFLILYTTTKKPLPALAGVALLILHPFFRFQALQEGTDMLAAGLQLLALAVVFVHVPGNRRMALLTSAAAGLLLGGAYAIRYTTLVLLPVVVIYLWLRDRADRRLWLLSLALFLGLFGLISLPQIAASTVVTGSPFYNEQARNVWFGLYGDFNWTENWRNIPPGITLGQIVRDDPAALLTHWAREFGRFLAYDPAAYADDPLALERKVTLWEPLLNHMIWLLSAILLPFDRRLSRPQKALLLMALVVPVLVTSMAWLFTRFLLVPLAIQVALVVLASGQVGERLARTERAAVPISLLLLLAFAALFQFDTGWHAKQGRTHEIVRRIEEAQPVLEAVGVHAPSELMTNNRLYQILGDPAHPQYPVFQTPEEQQAPLSTFLQQIRGPHRPDFLLFDWTSHAIRTIEVKPYRTALISAKDQLAPLQLTDAYSLYCVLPCRAGEATPVNETLDSGLTLAAYRAVAGESGRHGLYLYWMLDAPVPEARPISLTLRNEAGNIVFQTSGHPQQGTYSLDEWNVGELVTDFLTLSAEIRPDLPYFLTISLDGSNLAEPDVGPDFMTVPIIFSPPA